MKTNVNKILRDAGGRFKKSNKKVNISLKNSIQDKLNNNKYDNGTYFYEQKMNSIKTDKVKEPNIKELEDKFINNVDFSKFFNETKNLKDLSTQRTNAIFDFEKTIFANKDINSTLCAELLIKFISKINKTYDEKYSSFIQKNNIKPSRHRTITRTAPLVNNDINTISQFNFLDIENLDKILNKAAPKSYNNINKDADILEQIAVKATKRYWQAKKELVTVNKILENIYNGNKTLTNDEENIIKTFVDDEDISLLLK